MSNSKSDTKNKNHCNNESKNKINIMHNSATEKSSDTENDNSDSDGDYNTLSNDCSLYFRVLVICVGVWVAV